MAFLDRFRKKTEQKKSEKKQQESPAKTEQSTGQDKPESKFGSKADKKVVPRVYQIIKEPHITEKAGSLTDQNKYVFKVYSQANKKEIKKAVESLYKVEVERVNIIHSAAKQRRLGRYQGWRSGLKKGFKKAVVTLKSGDKIELLPR
ncbi:MAG: 50S ribosomal protein L23 [Patescibacteria group bacterium]